MAVGCWGWPGCGARTSSSGWSVTSCQKQQPGLPGKPGRCPALPVHGRKPGLAPGCCHGARARALHLQARLACPRRAPTPGCTARRRSTLALALLTTAALAVPFSPFHWGVISPHLRFAAVAAAAVALATVYTPPLLATQAMQRLGQISYSMYLVHFALLAPSLTLAEWLAPAGSWRTLLLHMLLTTAGSVALAEVTYRVVEQPAIKLAANWGHRAGTRGPDVLQENVGGGRR